MTFLPEEDREFLAAKELSFAEVAAATAPVQGPRAVVLRNVKLPPGKFLSRSASGVNAAISACDVLIAIPDGYPNATLDSFYTDPFLILATSGSPPQNCAGVAALHGRGWQYWSRHLQGANIWRPGIDGLHTYWDVVRAEIARA